MFLGVLKSGSPRLKLITSIPSLIILVAMLEILIVADSSTRLSLSDVIGMILICHILLVYERCSRISQPLHQLYCSFHCSFCIVHTFMSRHPSHAWARNPESNRFIELKGEIHNLPCSMLHNHLVMISITFDYRSYGNHGIDIIPLAKFLDCKRHIKNPWNKNSLFNCCPQKFCMFSSQQFHLIG